MKSVRSHHCPIVLLNCIGVLSENTDSFSHWQASQPGSSIAQNLMSVAGVASICARDAAAVSARAQINDSRAPMDATPATDIKFCAIDDPGCEACQ